MGGTKYHIYETEALNMNNFAVLLNFNNAGSLVRCMVLLGGGNVEIFMAYYYVYWYVIFITFYGFLWSDLRKGGSNN